MNNLKEIGLTEINKKQKKIINGGAHPLVWIVVGHVAIEAANDWEAHKEAFNEGYESAQ
ncbi:hypothetical protein [Fodinibius sp. Rm-B-1B1-1]|uniref:hypothetical protein n=1 Tax=Fodinibius alkaliphilus TaxID=3140241 RepID=UPI00315A3B0F